MTLNTARHGLEPITCRRFCSLGFPMTCRYFFSELTNGSRVGVQGSAHAEYEKKTWPVLQELAQNHPEAGIHFQRETQHDHSFLDHYADG